MRRQFFINLLFVLSLGALAGTWAFAFPTSQLQEAKNFRSFTPEPARTERYVRAGDPYAVKNVPLPSTTVSDIGYRSPLTLTFVGDIMLDRGVRASVERHAAGNFNWLFERVGELAQADILFGNLEGPVSPRGVEQGHLYSFRFPPAVVPALKQAGFDVLSIANNHIGDWGREGIADTLRLLNGNQLAAVGGGLDGAAATRALVLERAGWRVGFLAFNDIAPKHWTATAAVAGLPAQAGILSASDAERLKIIEGAREGVDLLIVSYHFGEEYQLTPSARQRKLAESSIESGADLVIGAHPHVVQPVERYQSGLIAYSLGNFIFDQNFSEETMRGLALSVRWGEAGLIDYEERSTQLDNQFRPRLQ